MITPAHILPELDIVREAVHKALMSGDALQLKPGAEPRYAVSPLSTNQAEAVGHLLAGHLHAAMITFARLYELLKQFDAAEDRMRRGRNTDARDVGRRLWESTIKAAGLLDMTELVEQMTARWEREFADLWPDDAPLGDR